MDEPLARVELVGPFQHHVVVVDGYEVPYLTAHPANGGVVRLTLDGRKSLDVPVSDFDAWVRFLADAVAVASGYSGHPSDEYDEPLVRSTGYHRLIGL